MSVIRFSTCIVTALGLILAGCSGIDQSQCPQVMCTQEFRVVQVKFVDSLDQGVSVKNFSAVVNRTGKPTTRNSDAVLNSQGNYVVASDADVRQLEERGDEITVSASHPVSGKIVTAKFVVSGGKCACHITKLEGPDQISF